MKIIIIIEKYGNHCNRLFQSLHFHSLAIEKNAKFINLSLLGNLKFDNKIFLFIDFLNNSFLKLVSNILNIFNKNNHIFFKFKDYFEITIVKGWDFRREELTKKHWIKLKKIYRFKKKLDKNNLTLIKKIDNLKKEGKFIVGIHIRKGDYKKWRDGIYYFDDIFYEKIIEKIKFLLINANKDPFIIVVSDEEISKNLSHNLKSNGSWIEDQVILQSCNLLLGPPSTFTMWASYISKIPLIQIKSLENLKLHNRRICKG